jgi:hypothetical protein
MRRGSALLLTLGVAFAGTATAGGVAAGNVVAGKFAAGDVGRPCDGTVVLRVSTRPNGFSPAGPEVRVLADGHVILRADPEGTPVTTIRVTDAGIERVLRRARRARLLSPAGLGDVDVADASTITFEVRDGARHRVVEIDALAPGDDGTGPKVLRLTAAQVAARARVARFAEWALDASSYRPYRRSEPVEPIDHPTGAHDVVLRTETSRNFWGGDYPDAARFTVFGDGRVELADGTTTHLSEAELQTLLCRASEVGLLGGTDFGHPLVTDQGTTTVEVHAAGVDDTLELYALELVEGDRGLPAAQRRARRDLRAFLHGVESDLEGTTTVRI